ncbi:hypothetical protein K469DRAFT_705780, partial [Zopfia rhizophila CBS 207.26]
MTEPKMDEVKADHKLKGKTNFIANDIFKYLTGEEIVPPKPRKEEYFPKPFKAKTHRSAQAKKTAQTVTPSPDDDNETDDAQAILMSTNNNLRWQIDYNEHKNAKEKMKFVGKLLDAWRARNSLLNQLSNLKLKDCSSVTEYTNRVRQIKANLKTVKYDITDDMLATALLHGLPPNYRGFKEKYDWIRSTKPDDPPDLNYLYDRLYVEEAKQLYIKKEKKAKEKAKKEAGSNNNTGGSTGYNSNQKLKHKDKSHLKCVYPGYGKTSHTKENYWIKNPDTIPRSLKDKFNTNINNRSIKDTSGIGGITETNLTTFRNAYTRADSL